MTRRAGPGRQITAKVRPVPLSASRVSWSVLTPVESMNVTSLRFNPHVQRPRSEHRIHSWAQARARWPRQTSVLSVGPHRHRATGGATSATSTSWLKVPMHQEVRETETPRDEPDEPDERGEPGAEGES